ncbi:MAG: hypothetical protein AVO33_02075 [delta proteobacterium ML8_F1]|nr:MAG: hypothetical protein AVO33_02075 [delta proteobacterium ML8_F1]
MKIIVSPAKTQDFMPGGPKELSVPAFEREALFLADRLSDLTKDELGRLMKIKGELLDRTCESYRDFSAKEKKAALWTYSGEVFKQLGLEEYTSEEIRYLDEHLLILSALYGVLRPRDGIRPYRLDMTMKVPQVNLYQWWSTQMSEVFSKDEVILSLASKEFSKMVPYPLVEVLFKQKTPGGGHKEVAIYSKQARGLMLRYMVKQNVKQPGELRHFRESGYRYEEVLSGENRMVFVR